jgi:hypothetical protein
MLGGLKYSLQFIFLFGLLQSAYGQRAFDPSIYCAIVPENSKLGSIEGNCQQYFTCSKGKANPNTCPSGQLYDKDSQICKTASLVNCPSSNPCAGVNDGFVSVPGSCTNYYYCQNGVKKAEGVCPNGSNFVNGFCTYDPCSPTTATGLTTECQIVPLNKYYGSLKNCASWQRCTSSTAQPSSGQCTNNLVYDVNAGVCTYASKVDCGIRPNPPTGSCTDGKLLTDNQDCSVYYKCVNSKWESQPKCQPGYGYDIDKGCLPIQEALTNPKCNRCANMPNDIFINAVDPDCRTYLYCKNGLATNGTCSAGQIFNGVGCTSVKPDELPRPCFKPDDSTTNAPLPPNGATTDAPLPPNDATTDAPLPPNGATPDAPLPTDGSPTDAPLPTAGATPDSTTVATPDSTTVAAP